MSEEKKQEARLARFDLILQALCADQCAPKSASEIAALTGIPLQSVIRNLEDMTEVGWTKKYKEYFAIGDAIVAVGNAFFMSIHTTVKNIEEKSSAMTAQSRNQ